MAQNEADRQRNEREQQTQQYDSFLYKFQQQIIDAWKPVPHTSSNVVLYIILSAICIGLGLGLILSAPSTQQVYVRYDNISGCTIDTARTLVTNANCKAYFTLTETLSAPVYFYYGFKGFYQNHRRYLKYFSSTQLSTGDPNASGASSDCGDYYTNQQTFGPSAKAADDSTTLSPGTPAFPCGTIARVFYKLRHQIQDTKLFDSTPTQIPMTKTGIAWPSDIGRHVGAGNTVAGIDVTSQSWLVWFRPAARSDFYKLAGKIERDLLPGTYYFQFLNHYDASFGQKWFSISKSNFVGNRDLFLGIAFLALGGGCFILLIVFLAKWIAQKRDNKSNIE